MAAPEYLTANAGLVHLHAKRFSWACGGCIDYDDLIQAGNIGLMYAAEHFDASRGMKFSSYAALCIRTKIKEEAEYQSRTINLPVSYRRKVWKEGGGGISPHGFSLDSDYEHQRSPADAMADDAGPDSGLEAQERDVLVGRIKAFIETRFKDRDQRILTLFYFDGAKQSDIATMVALSRERVRQVCADGVEAIRQHLGVSA